MICGYPLEIKEDFFMEISSENTRGNQKKVLLIMFGV